MYAEKYTLSSLFKNKTARQSLLFNNNQATLLISLMLARKLHVHYP